MNHHSWKEDKCVKCGCERKKDYPVIGTVSVLKKSGIFEDMPKYGKWMEWKYKPVNGKWTFERPNCVK